MLAKVFWISESKNNINNHALAVIDTFITPKGWFGILIGHFNGSTEASLKSMIAVRLFNFKTFESDLKTRVKYISSEPMDKKFVDISKAIWRKRLSLMEEI